ncbi:uncharacterized protein CTRU02_207460 [Colletotrichum truncatum]|uniref:Uncharacterized protein n=1 Tax=Colletotrichum truncatum TaxID=5467 RepID=A0ACC3Z0W9_COLTU|nr:uncharacterized protein CTRU02_00905 [Colletotrichum truncatum]KAF6800500.1 hypothetical protein CTRU02_00905 [Colletotrichum truncatum]
MEAIRQRIQAQIPENIKQLPGTLKPKPPTHLENGAESIPASLAPTVVSPTLPTPTVGHEGAVFTIAYATPIAAPPLTVLATFINPATYPSWNPVTPRVTITRPAVSPVPPLLAESSVANSNPAELMLESTHITFEVHMNLDPAKSTTNSTCVITKLEDFNKVTTTSTGEHKGRKGYRVAWKTTGYAPPAFLLRIERVHEFLESEDGTGTEYRQYETFFGPVAHLMRLTMVSQLETTANAFMDGLKKFVESGGTVTTTNNEETAAAAAPASAAPATTAPAAATPVAAAPVAAAPATAAA